jgi:hypothetical protein
LEIENGKFARMRSMVLMILVSGLMVTGTELMLHEHFEDSWQLVPLGLIAIALLTFAWHGLMPGPASVRAIQAVMTLCVAAGFTGIVLHYRANAEFARELDPSATDFALFKQAMMGGAPALAPGAMIMLGLLGLVYAHRHPRLTAAASETVMRRQEWDV